MGCDYGCRGRKLYADGKGVETEAPLDESIDIGVFTVDPSRETFSKSDVLSMQKQRVQSGKHTFTVVVDQEPKFGASTLQQVY